ncbi:ClpP/crotonase [Mrakia frigida]|uniref:ClpP/crotonase n=1 Tax=Mrakia frigida TaxID=29902 RepID=UPI003FCC15E4
MAYPTPTFIASSRPSPHVLLLSLARPPVNAFSEAFWRELGDTFKAAGRDDDVRVVVLASDVEKGFTAGLDLMSANGEIGAYGRVDPARSALAMRPHITDFQDAISQISHCRVPVITAVHGLCLGLGLDIISAADVRVCSSDAKFSIREVVVGLAADIGSLQRVPKVVGNDSLARELALTGRFFDAREAEKMGLVSRIVTGSRIEVLSDALGMAEEIAKLSPIAVIGTKHLLDHARDHTIQESLDYTSLWNSVMLQSQDFPATVASFATKKKVVFESLGAKPQKRGQSKL